MIEFIYYTGADEYTKKGGYTEEGTPNVFCACERVGMSDEQRCIASACETA
jgi:hypothetical protein